MIQRVLIVFVTVFISFTLSGQETERPLLFVGGGSLTEALYEEFAKFVGSDIKLVVIPTASSSEPDIEKITERWAARGIKDVVVLHTRDREVSMKPEFSEVLKEANAVWISGGSQSRISDAYLDTPVEDELYKLVDRGGIIGGSSAGAAIQSKIMIQGGRIEPEMGTGFDLMKNVVLDQHFLKRNRLARLMAAVRSNPQLTGFGIDEATAILVYENEYRILGDSFVMRIQLVDGEIKIDAFEDGDVIPASR